MQKNVKILFVLILTGLCLAWPISSFVTTMEKPPGEVHLTELDKLASSFLDDTNKGDMEAARQKVNKLAELFPNQTLPVSIRIESLNAVTQSILAAKKGFSSDKISEERLLWYATQVRVAIDALSHPHQPMWRNYYSPYAEQMQNLMQASVERDLTTLRAQFDENHQLYLVIRPAMSVHTPEQRMNNIDATYNVIMKQLRNPSVEWQEIREALRDLHTEMQEVFVGEDKSALGILMGPDSPYMLMLTITTVVTLTLAYVAWVKYSAQQAV